MPNEEHPLLQRRVGYALHEPPAEGRRRLVDAEHAAHAVAGAVVVVQSLLPQGHPRQRVQILPHDAPREPRHGQPDMSPQHQRGHAALLRRYLAQRHGAGHIGGAAAVVPAAVHQQQPVPLQRHVRLLRGLIVNHRAVGAVGDDSREAVLPEFRLRRPAPVQQRRGGQLRVVLRMRFHVVQEPAHRRAVLHMGAAEALLLPCGLHRLAAGGRAVRVQPLRVGEAPGDAGVGRGAVRHDPCAGGQRLQQRVYVPVGTQRHAVRRQLPPDVLREALRLGAQDGLLPAQQQKAQKYRRTRHIAAPQLQRPRRVCQVGEQQIRRVPRRHILPQQRQLLPPGHAAVKRPHRRGGQGRSARPDALRRIEAAVHADALARQRLFQRAIQLCADGAPIKAQRAALRQSLRQKSRQRRHARLSGAHEFNAAAGQLPLRL